MHGEQAASQLFTKMLSICTACNRLDVHIDMEDFANFERLIEMLWMQPFSSHMRYLFVDAFFFFFKCLLHFGNLIAIVITVLFYCFFLQKLLFENHPISVCKCNVSAALSVFDALMVPGSAPSGCHAEKPSVEWRIHCGACGGAGPA